MKSLSTLEIKGRSSCLLYRLTNETFANFKPTNLSTLKLEACPHLSHVEPCAFCPLRHLTRLSLRDSNWLGVSRALRSVYAMTARNVSELDFRGIAKGNWQRTKGTILDPYVTEFLLQTCVSTLILADNDITAIRAHSLSRDGSLFNQCIRHMDFSRNYIFDVSLAEYLVFATSDASLPPGLQLAICR